MQYLLAGIEYSNPRGKAEHLPRVTGTEGGWVSQGLCSRVAALLLTLHLRHHHHLLFGKGTAGKRALLRNDMLTLPCCDRDGRQGTGISQESLPRACDLGHASVSPPPCVRAYSCCAPGQHCLTVPLLRDGSLSDRYLKKAKPSARGRRS